jgi:hypothetical protein
MALTALVLIRLDARLGEWVSVADLARAVRLSEETLRTHLDFMADDMHAGFHLQHEGGVIVAAQVARKREATDYLS